MLSDFNIGEQVTFIDVEYANSTGLIDYLDCSGTIINITERKFILVRFTSGYVIAAFHYRFKLTNIGMESKSVVERKIKQMYNRQPYITNKGE